MTFILYSPGTSVTGKALAEKLGIQGGTQPPKIKHNFIIRWGSTARIPLKPGRIINKLANVALTADKLQASRTLANAGVTTPEIFTTAQANELKGYIKLPALGRRIHHTQGRDIILCLQAIDVRRAINRGESDYFIIYIPTKREFRIHVFNNKIIRVNQKLLRDGGIWVPFIRNFENGYVFGLPKKPLLPDQEQLAIKAVSTLGLDFGAVDLVVSDDDKSYVLEVNTAPALIDNGLEIYEAEFRKILGPNGSIL